MRRKTTLIKRLALPVLLCAAVVTAFAAPAVPARYSGEPRTIAHDFLDIEKGLGAAGDQYPALNALINRAAAKVRVEKSYTTEGAIGTLRAMDAFLKSEGFTFRNNYLLGVGLKTKKIDCDNYCALYVAIAEALRIPIVPAYAPNHSFIRFFFENGEYVNWETTEGVSRPDSYYVEALRIPKESIKAGVYLKTLTRREFLGVGYNNAGAYLMAGRKFADAVPYFSAAVRLYPKFSSAYHNRGSSFYALKLADEALADLLKANGLDPSRAGTHNTLGDIYLDRKDLDRALKEFTISIKLDPANYVPYNSIAIIMKLRGDEAKAGEWLQKSQEVKKRYGK